jgi:hypothetical protein
MENICFEFDGCNCSVIKKKYPNGQIRLQLYDTSDGMPFMTASVLIESYKLSKQEIAEGYTFIKDYAENYGILKLLIDNNVDINYEDNLGNNAINSINIFSIEKGDYENFNIIPESFKILDLLIENGEI